MTSPSEPVETPPPTGPRRLGHAVGDILRFPGHRDVGRFGAAIGSVAGLLVSGIAALIRSLGSWAKREVIRFSRFRIADLMGLTFVAAILLAARYSSSSTTPFAMIALFLAAKLIQRLRIFGPPRPPEG